MTPTLEDQLTASIALVNARKAEAGIHLMPAPPPPGSEIPRVLSPSSVNTFLHDCSLKWFYRKVLKLPETRGSALGLGTAVHTALIENFRQKIETRQDLDVSGVRALFTGALIEEMDTVKLQKEESWDDLKEAGEVMTQVFMERVAPGLDPAAVEQKVEGLIGDVAVHGYIDVLDVHGRVIDIKTAKRKPTGITAAHQLQLGTYVILHPQASGEAQLLTLTKTKTVDLHSETARVTPADRTLTERLYSIARDQMQAGLYAPNRASFLCSRKYCGYWRECQDEFGGLVAGEAGE